MAIVKVFSSKDILGSGGGTTGSKDSTGSTMLVVAIGYYGGGNATITDSKGNSWQYGTAYVEGGFPVSVRIAYCKNPTVGSGHTFTCGAGYSALAIVGYSGTNISASFDVENGNTATGGASVSTGSITPNYNNELIISACAQQSGTTPAIDSGFTIDEHQAFGSGTNEGIDIAHKIQTTATAVNPQWSSLAGASAVAIMSLREYAADSTPPDGEITVPTTGANISGASVNVQGTCSDNLNHVSSIQLKLDGVNWGALITGSGLTSFNVNRDSTGVTNGSYSLTAVIADSEGNEFTTSAITVNIQNAPTAGFSFSGLDGGGNIDPTLTLGISNSSLNASSYAWKVNGVTVSETTATPNLSKYLVQGDNIIRQTVTNAYGSHYVEHTVTKVKKYYTINHPTVTKVVSGLSVGLPVIGRVNAVDVVGNESEYCSPQTGTVT